MGLTPTWVTVRAGQTIVVPGDVLFLYFSVPGANGASLESTDLDVDQLLGGALPRLLSEHFASILDLSRHPKCNAFLRDHFPAEGNVRADAFNQAPHRYACSFLTTLLAKVEARALAAPHSRFDASHLKVEDLNATRYWTVTALHSLHRVRQFMEHAYAARSAGAHVGYAVCECDAPTVRALDDRLNGLSEPPPPAVLEVRGPAAAAARDRDAYDERIMRAGRWSTPRETSDSSTLLHVCSRAGGGRLTSRTAPSSSRTSRRCAWAANSPPRRSPPRVVACSARPSS
jgi:hypothetical protein